MVLVNATSEHWSFVIEMYPNNYMLDLAKFVNAINLS